MDGVNEPSLQIKRLMTQPVGGDYLGIIPINCMVGLARHTAQNFKFPSQKKGLFTC